MQAHEVYSFQVISSNWIPYTRSYLISLLLLQAITPASNVRAVNSDK
jgi:hypothetical protein